MKIATDLGDFSNWRKFKIENDTLYHTTFGEWRDSTKAKINYVGKNGMELYYPEDGITLNFKRIEQLNN